MTASKHVTIWCEDEGKYLPEDAWPKCEFHAEFGDTAVVRTARKLARRGGWRVIGGRDVCPVCAPYAPTNGRSDRG